MSRSTELERFFELSLDVLCIAGLDGTFRRVNPAFEQTLGWSAEELTSRPFLDFVHPEDREATRRELETLGRGRETLSFENRYRTADGSYRWLHWTAHPEPATGEFFAIARDVTDRVAAERQIRRQAEELAAMNRSLQLVATTDPLTEVLNRRAFAEQLDNQLRMTWRIRRPLTLAVLELGDLAAHRRDDGDETADRVLRDFGRLLREATRRTDVAARLSDDEFALILPFTGATGSRTVAERIVARAEAYARSRGGPDVRIGLATLEVSELGAEYVERAGSRLLAAANRALDRARRRGGTLYFHAGDPGSGELRILQPD